MSKCNAHYVLTNEGYRPQTGSAKWHRHIDDLRAIEGVRDTLRICDSFTLLSFHKDYTILVLVQIIKGNRGGDNEALWLYIPNTVQFLDGEFVREIKKLKEDFRNRTIDPKALDISTWGKETSNPFVYGQSVKAKPAKVAVRFIEDCPNLLDDAYRFQKAYEPYNYIILTDTTEDAQRFEGVGLPALRNKELKQLIILTPPSPNVLADRKIKQLSISLDGGANYEPFNKRVSIFEDMSLLLKFERTGFIAVTIKCSLSERGDWEKQLTEFTWTFNYNPKKSLELFYINERDEEVTINNAKISIDGKPIIGVTKLIDKADYQLKIEAENLDTIIKTMSRTELKAKNKLEMKTAQKVETIDLEGLKNGQTKDIKVSLSGRPFGPYDELANYIYGYKKSESGRLVFNDKIFIKPFIAGFIACLLLLSLCYGIVKTYRFIDRHTFSLELSWPPIKYSSKNVEEAKAETPKPRKETVTSKVDSIHKQDSLNIEQTDSIKQEDEIVSNSEKEKKAEEAKKERERKKAEKAKKEREQKKAEKAKKERERKNTEKAKKERERKNTDEAKHKATQINKSQEEANNPKRAIEQVVANNNAKNK